MNDHKKLGFTLIELLVVIAIISILAAILFPVFASAREKARQTACLSNLKQLGLAVTQYEQDYDEYPPCGVNWYTPGGNGWAGQIYPYVKSTGVYMCPDDPDPDPHCSYSYNSNVIQPPNGSTVTSYPLAQFASPSKTVLLSEMAGNYSSTIWTISDPASVSTSDAYMNAGTGGYSPSGNGTLIAGDGRYGSAGYGTLQYVTGYIRNASTQYYSQPAYYYYSGATGRHTGGANYLLADDHAKFFRPAAVSAGSTNSSTTDCGTGNTNPSGYIEAAGTSCSDSTLAATFSLQ